MATYLKAAEDGRVLSVFSADTFPDLPVAYDDDGEVTETVRHPAISDDAIEVDEAVAATLESDPGPWRWTGETVEPYVTPVPFEAQRAAKIAAVNATADAILAEGYPASDGLHVDVSDGSRADLGGMATTALGASSGALPWPDSYKEGWITIENVRIPMPEPADGLMLAAAAGEFYAVIKQRARDLKDAVLAATDEAALNAIDIEAGWPA